MPAPMRLRVLEAMKEIVKAVVGPWAKEAGEFISNLEANLMILSDEAVIAKTQEWQLLLDQAPPSVLEAAGYIG